VLFAVTDFLDTDYVALLAAEAPLPQLTEVVVISGDVPDGATSMQDFLGRGKGVSDGAVVDREAAVGPGDLSDVVFTSGTTGRPKGAMLTHGASVRTYEAWTDSVGLRAGDRVLMVYPFFHTAGLKAGILSCALRGCALIPHPVFGAESVMARVERERITVLPGPPAIFQSILTEPSLARFDLTSLRLGITGAAMVPVDMVEAMHTDLGFDDVVTAYGLTETHGTVSACRHGDPVDTVATTVGKPLPGVEVRTVDHSGIPCPVGTTGEIVVRGFNVMAGYLGDADSTNQAIDGEGWLHTGDVGSIGGDGNLRFTGRMKDIFIVGGFNASPAEIEEMILRHPSVAEVGVVGAPDERLGEVAMAFVAPRAGQQIDPDELASWCRSRMANYKVPRHVEIVAHLPLNASGKVMRGALRQEAVRIVEAQESGARKPNVGGIGGSA
jgi:acyl-CoA synthetase (AMP-forming)/AMP-acid ligase II